MRLFLFLLMTMAANCLTAQIINPYSDFAYEPKNKYVLSARNHTVQNKDTEASVSKIIINSEKRIAYLYGKDSLLIAEMMLNEREVLRFLSVDPITKEYPMLTPYQFASNQPIWAIDLDGLEAKVKITTEVTGYTVQRVTGYVPSNNAMVVVPTFKVVLTDAAKPNKIVSLGNVTRDSWYSRGQNSAGQSELINRHFEPASPNVNLYTGERTAYPPSTDLRSYKMTQYGSPFLNASPHSKMQETHLDGSPILEARSNYSQASNIYFHIGGFYQHTPGPENSLAASYGCFGFVSSPQVYKTVDAAQQAIDNGTWNDKGTSNAEYGDFMKKIQTVRDKYDGTDKDKVLFEILQRTNVKEKSTKKL